MNKNKLKMILAMIGMSSVITGFNNTNNNLQNEEDVNILNEETMDLEEKLDLLSKICETDIINKYTDNIDYNKIYDKVDFDNELISDTLIHYNDLKENYDDLNDEERLLIDEYGISLALYYMELNDYINEYGYDIALVNTDGVVKEKVVDYVDSLSDEDYFNFSIKYISDNEISVINNKDELIANIDLNDIDFKDLVELYNNLINYSKDTSINKEEYNNEGIKMINKALYEDSKALNPWLYESSIDTLMNLKTNKEEIDDLKEKLSLINRIVNTTNSVERYSELVDYENSNIDVDFDNSVISDAIELYNELDTIEIANRTEEDKKEIDKYGKFLALSFMKLNEYMYNYGYDIAYSYSKTAIKSRIIDSSDLKMESFDNIDFGIYLNGNVNTLSIRNINKDKEMFDIDLNKTDYKNLVSAHAFVSLANCDMHNLFGPTDYNESCLNDIKIAIDETDKVIENSRGKIVKKQLVK